MATGQVRVSMGGREFATLARDLRRAGRTDLRAELTRGLMAARAPVVQALQRSATDTLPNRGGLAARVAGSQFAFRTLGGSDPHVEVTATERPGAPVDLATLDDGSVLHPVFGGRRWVRQRVTPQWFTRAIEEQESTFEAALSDAVQRVLSDLENG